MSDSGLGNVSRFRTLASNQSQLKKIEPGAFAPGVNFCWVAAEEYQLNRDQVELRRGRF
jgi:hypothetical protein